MKPLRLASLFRVLAFVVVMSALAAGQKQQLRFANPVAYDSGGLGADSVAIGDLNGDGIQDLVVANGQQNGNGDFGEVAVLLGNGDGSFQPAVTYVTGAYDASAVALGDLRGNGILDLVVTDVCSSLGQFENCVSPGVASVLLGNGDGTFQPAVTYSVGAPGAYSVTIADLQGNGILDLVVADISSVEYEGAVAVLLGNGDGTFQPAVNYNSGGDGSSSAAVGDFNGDGIPDIVVTNSCQSESCQSDGTVGVMLGNGDGTFQPVVTYDSGSLRSDWVAAADLTGNGIVDLVVDGGAGNVVGVLLGNGDGTFQAPLTYVVDGVAGGKVAIGDMNGDGIPDLAVTDACTKLKDGACTDAKVIVLLGNGDGTFQPQIPYSTGGIGAFAVAIGDVNGDGRPDLVVADCCQSDLNTEGSAVVFLNETSYSTKTTLTSSPNPALVNQTVTFTATITSTPSVPNGEVVTFYNGKTELGTGATTNGVATLSTSFAKAKSYTIKASYSGDAFRKASSGTVKQVVNP
jgi:Big-like domain-containing protein/VCBS repeat protein